MEKLAYIFTNGISANLVVLFNQTIEDVDTETLNEKVLNEVLLPNEYNNCYCTVEELEKYGWSKDEEGYYNGMISVYANDNKEYFFNEDNLIVKYVSNEEINSYCSLYWCAIVELN